MEGAAQHSAADRGVHEIAEAVSAGDAATVRAVLEFDLPEDQGDFLIASNAMDWALVVNEMDEWLRSKIKHEDKDYQEVRDWLSDALAYRNLTTETIP